MMISLRRLAPLALAASLFVAGASTRVSAGGIGSRWGRAVAAPGRVVHDVSPVPGRQTPRPHHGRAWSTRILTLGAALLGLAGAPPHDAAAANLGKPAPGSNVVGEPTLVEIREGDRTALHPLLRIRAPGHVNVNELVAKIFAMKPVLSGGSMANDDVERSRILKEGWEAGQSLLKALQNADSPTASSFIHLAAVMASEGMSPFVIRSDASLPDPSAWMVVPEGLGPGMVFVNEGTRHAWLIGENGDLLAYPVASSGRLTGGEYQITFKADRKKWRPTAAQQARAGGALPSVVPVGDGNPLGYGEFVTGFQRIGARGRLLPDEGTRFHETAPTGGTQTAEDRATFLAARWSRWLSVGLPEVTDDCFRLFPGDAQSFYAHVKKGWRVVVRDVREAVGIARGRDGDQVVVQAHWFDQRDPSGKVLVSDELRGTRLVRVMQQVQALVASRPGCQIDDPAALEERVAEILAKSNGVAKVVVTCPASGQGATQRVAAR